MPWDHPSPFCQNVAPQADDIDGLHHTNNAVYVRWCERVAWAHSEQLGLSLADYQRLDRAMAIQRAEYAYLLPTFLGEPLVLGTWLQGGENRLQMMRRFQLCRVADGETVMRGSWDLVCIELSGGQPRRMPPAFVQAYVRDAQAAETPPGEARQP